MVTWEMVQHQVAIAGRVTDARTGKGLAAMQVGITAAPAAFTAWLTIKALQYGQWWETLSERPDRFRTAPDGHFHCLDLPDGTYTLSAAWPEGGSRYGTAQVEVTVARDPEGNLTRAVADLALPPTTLTGQISNQDGVPVVLAMVQVQGSGEYAFSDAQGHYHLIGLEAGQRVVLIAATGYEPVIQTVQLSQAGGMQTLDVQLTS